MDSNESSIETASIDEMIKITAGFVRLGIQFTCRKGGNSKWFITTTGGH